MGTLVANFRIQKWLWGIGLSSLGFRVWVRARDIGFGAIGLRGCPNPKLKQPASSPQNHPDNSTAQPGGKQAGGIVMPSLLEGSWCLITNYNCTYNCTYKPLKCPNIVIIWVISTVIIGY